jgi:hypothetical protein
MSGTRRKVFYGWWIVLAAAVGLFWGPPITVYVYAADHLRCHRKEMRPALPRRVLLAAQLQVDLTHQRCAL